MLWRAVAWRAEAWRGCGVAGCGMAGCGIEGCGIEGYGVAHCIAEQLLVQVLATGFLVRYLRPLHSLVHRGAAGVLLYGVYDIGTGVRHILQSLWHVDRLIAVTPRPVPSAKKGATCGT
jgi:hypothetical protein